jgi:spore maturation protein CgeB
LRIFYDLDTPVTLSRLQAGETTTYIGPRGLRDFDLVLSYTGGRALDALRDGLGARRVLPLYGHVDPEVHRPAPPQDHYRADLSYLGTYAADRQAALEACSSSRPACGRQSRFLIGGAQYPPDFPGRPTSSSSGTCRRRSTRPSSLVAAHPQRDPAGDGGDGLVPLRPPVRGRRLRHAAPDGRVGGA